MLARRWMALSAVVVMVGMSACADDSSTADLERSAPTSTTDLEQSASASTADTVAPIPAVFEWVDCDRFTGEELNAVIDRAQAKAGTDFPFERFDVEPVCWTSGSPGLVGTPAGAYWDSPGWREGELSEGAVIVGIETSDQPVDDESWQRLGYRAHAMLDESVHYQLDSRVYGTADTARVAGRLWLGGQPIIEFFLNVVDAESSGGGNSPKYETVALAIANEMLREMGWID